MTKQCISTTCLSARGQITIPAELRRALGLSRDAPVLLIPVGEVLVLAPADAAFVAVTERLRAAMDAAGCTVEDLVAAAAEVRAEIARQEFGEAADR